MSIQPVTTKPNRRQGYQFKTRDRTLQLLSAMHSTLDIKHVILYYTHALAKIVRCEGVEYQHQESGTSFTLGRGATHTMSMELTSDDKALGLLTLSRSTPFNDVELLQIEDTACLLIAPLKNAIAHHQAVFHAHHDELTKLQNRTLLKPTLNREMKLAQRYKTPLSILMFDLDDFKKINDQLGHLAGDAVLSHFAKVIQAGLRETDLTFRIGGEEFITILAKTDNLGAKILADRICQLVHEHQCNFQGHNIQYTTSIGVAELGNNDSIDAFLERADNALYSAKQAGKNQAR